MDLRVFIVVLASVLYSFPHREVKRNWKMPTFKKNI